MDDTTDRLKTLSPAEKELLYTIIKAYEQGKRLTNKELAKKLNKSEKTIKEQRGSIYDKLGIKGNPDEKEKLLVERIKNIWQDSVINSQVKSETQSKTLSELILLVPSEPYAEPSETESQARQSETKPTVIPRWALALIAVVSILLAFIYFRANPAISILTATNVPTNIIQPTVKPTERQGSIPVPLPTDDTVVSPTFTVLPPTFTPSATASPIPTDTIAPSETPNEPTLFEDNFDNGLSPKWKVLQGHPYVYNGVLTSDDMALVMIGDKTWKNYKVTFDVTGLFCNPNNDSYVGVRANDAGNFIAWFYSPCSTGWNIVKNNQPQLVQATYNNGGMNEYLPMVVQVTGSNFQGLDYPAYANTDFPSGGVVLWILRTAKIDNFKVIQLP